MITTNGTYPGSFVTQILRKGKLSHGGDHKFSKLRIKKGKDIIYIADREI